MFEHRKIKTSTGYIGALAMDLGQKRLIVLRGRRGYVMCGYLDIAIARKFKEAAVKITGVSSIRGALAARVFACTPQAARLGIYPGQPVKEVLETIA